MFPYRFTPMTILAQAIEKWSSHNSRENAPV